MYKLDTLDDLREITHSEEYKEYLKHEMKDSTIKNFISFINKENGILKEDHHFTTHEKHIIENFEIEEPTELPVDTFLKLERITSLFFFQKILKNYPFTLHLIENIIYRNNFLNATELTDFCFVTRLKMLHRSSSEPVYMLFKWVSDTRSITMVSISIEGESKSTVIDLDDYKYVFTSYENTYTSQIEKESTFCLKTGNVVFDYTDADYGKVYFPLRTIEEAKRIAKSKYFTYYYKNNRDGVKTKEQLFIEFYTKHVDVRDTLASEVKHYLRYITDQLPDLTIRDNKARLAELIHGQLFQKYDIKKQPPMKNPRFISRQYSYIPKLVSDNYQEIPLYYLPSSISRLPLVVKLDNEGDDINFYYGEELVYQIRKFMFSKENGEDLSLLERYVTETFIDKVGYEGYSTKLLVHHSEYPYIKQSHELTFTLHDGAIQFAEANVMNYRKVPFDTLKGRAVYMECSKNVVMGTPSRVENDPDIYVKEITLGSLVTMDWS